VVAWRNTAPENVWRRAHRQKSTALPADFTLVFPLTFRQSKVHPKILTKPALSILTVISKSAAE